MTESTHWRRKTGQPGYLQEDQSAAYALTVLDECKASGYLSGRNLWFYRGSRGSEQHLRFLIK